MPRAYEPAHPTATIPRNAQRDAGSVRLPRRVAYRSGISRAAGRRAHRRSADELLREDVRGEAGEVADALALAICHLWRGAATARLDALAKAGTR